MPTDRIEKRILLRAPRSRVWSALTDSEQFGEWFGIPVDEPFVAGKNVKGVIVGTKVDAGSGGCAEEVRRQNDGPGNSKDRAAAAVLLLLASTRD